MYTGPLMNDGRRGSAETGQQAPAAAAALQLTRKVEPSAV